MRVSAFSDVGTRREINEDSMFASEDSSLPLYVVADGMGGHNAGDTASKMAVDIIKEEFILNNKELDRPDKIREFIKTTLNKANELIYRKSNAEIDCEGMGTTVILAYYFDNMVYIGHIGDSRAYTIVGNKIHQITEDHTLVNELLKKGSITESQAQNHPQRNVITQALGTDIDVEMDINIINFNVGDILLLCSDGLYNMLDEETILKILKESTYLEEGVKLLIDIANSNGGQDNITVIAIKLNDEVLE